MNRLAAVAALAAALAVVPVAAQDRAKAAHDVLIEVPTVLAPGSKAAARVVVYETRGINSVAPIEGATVRARLKGQSAVLFEGKTAAGGAADVAFTVPDLPDGDHTLVIQSESTTGKHEAEIAIKLQRDLRILLVTDKPLYQPGQVIHLRALAMDAMTMRALGRQPILFEVEDSKGNKVFKRQDETNAYGIAAMDFQLADEVLMGEYKIVATLGAAKSEKTVTVKKYVLPKFKLEARTDKPFYRPQEKIKGTLQADYFFGKPVAGEVVIKASTFDVAFREFQTARVRTDAKGVAEFEIQLPDYFVGQPLEKGNAFVQLEVTLTDSADHAETVTKTAIVCSQPILVGAVPESGKIVPGLENIVYVLAASPDGAPVEADVTLKTAKQEVSGRTNASGMAALRLTPAAEEMAGPTLNVSVSVRDKQGNEATRSLALSSEPGKDQILLRASAPILKVGETLGLDVFGSFDKTVAYVDIVRRGQTVLTTTCALDRGRGRCEVPLTADLFGSLEIHAYAFMGDSTLVRDSRLVVVQPAQELRIDVRADQPQYVPGQEASISFRVTDESGQGVPSALGVIVVDESVYALQEMQPGLEKIAFMLQKELLAPKIEIKWGGGIAEALQDERRREAATVLLAPVVLPERRATINTMAARVGQMAGKVQQIYWALYVYIANEKGKFWVEREGRRAMNPAILEDLAKAGKLAKEMLVDGWGNRLTVEQLGAVNEGFTFDHWARLMSATNVQTIFHVMRQAASEHDITASDILQQLVKAKRLAPEQLKDYFGDALTPEALAKADPAFARDNLARIMEDARRQALFNRLVELAGQSQIITPDYRYVPDVMKKVGGAPFDLEALAKENAAFAPSNIAKIASVSRCAAIYQALTALAQKGGFDKVVESDGKAWRYRKDILRTLVAEKVLQEGQTVDVAGRAFDVAELAREDAQFAAPNMVAAVLRGAAQKIDSTVCSQLHGNRQDLPKDALAQLVEKQALSEGDVTDPWGTRYRFVAGLPTTLGCGLLSGRYTLVSAGPDGAFDTADDVNVGGMALQAGYQANMADCVYYGQDPNIRWLAAQYELRGFAVKEMPQEEGWARAAGAPPPAPAATAGSMPEEKALADAPEPDGDDAGPMRIREYFPETLAWKPVIITDADGRARLALTMADSITTWRLSASANTIDGRLGSTTAGLLVFQDFFVDIDLPVSLTQNDAVSVPVAVYNYLKEKQTVTLTLASDDWFELRDDAVKSVEMEPGQVKVVYYRIRAKGLGSSNRLEIQARGAKAKDAIRRSVEVVPDGKLVETVYNGQLSGEIRHTISIPLDAVPGASKILFKAYPGVFASVLDGLEGMLRMPGG
ncbi:MAG: hypothetical protein HYY16_08580 [Planctomycetes bacterium]|nr:hypothetical protein [Planctomycetota bacterium]